MLVPQYDHDTQLTLGTLGGNDLIAQPSKIDQSRTRGFRVTKSRIFAEMIGKTTAEGPLMFGIAANASAAEIEAIIEADPQNPHDDDSRGKGVFIKLLRLIGQDELQIPLASAPGQLMEFELSYGKNGWSIPQGEALSYWAYNMQAGALTTGTIFNIAAEHLGVWLRD